MMVLNLNYFYKMKLMKCKLYFPKIINTNIHLFQVVYMRYEASILIIEI